MCLCIIVTNSYYSWNSTKFSCWLWYVVIIIPGIKVSLGTAASTIEMTGFESTSTGGDLY